MLDFQRYQAEFTAHIRAPKLHKKPAKVDAQRMAVYEKAVFNNIAESVSVCFPVSQAVLGKHVWDKILHEFVAKFAAASPIFREIPAQFLQFLSAKKLLPISIQQLAHYEWVELAINTQQTEAAKLSQKMNLLDEKPILAPAHMLLEYDYAIHKISKRNPPRVIEKTYLLVFRNSEFKVKFIELNPTTYQLLRLIQENSMTGKQALVRLAEDIKHPDTDAIIQFGAGILSDLANQQAIVGSRKLARP